MLNIILLYAVCLYFVTKGYTKADDCLIQVILLILIVCLMAGFLYYCTAILALTALNWLGYFGLAGFIIYLGNQ